MFLLISHFYKKSICNTIYAGAVRLFDVMQWTDRIHQIKILLVLGTVFVAVASLAVAHFLISDLEQEERKKMEVWAEAMNTLNNADEWTDLNLVLKVLNGNTTIPVIVMDRAGNVQTFRNLDIPADSSGGRLRPSECDFGQRGAAYVSTLMGRQGKIILKFVMTTREC